VTPHIGATFSLEETRAGLAMLMERKIIGKAIILP
jgi:hypothetical protein